jgi:hypothetical protein
LETHRNKSCLNQECSELANKRKWVKLLLLQNLIDQTEDYILILGAVPVETSTERNMTT